MSIGWSEIAPGLRALFSDMALANQTSPEFLAHWEDGPREMVHPEIGMELTLKITRVVGIGLDELRYENNDDGNLEETVVGHRQFTLQVRVESHFHGEEETPESAWCWTMIERLRTSIRRSRNRAALEALNVSLVDILQANDATFTFDKRRANAAVCEFVMMTAVCDTDPVLPGWIEHVELTSLIKGVDGELLPEPPNFTDEIVPPL